MIKRIVKMTFKKEEVEVFKEIFKQNWTYIQSFEGCSHVELLQDEHTQTVFFTYSLWRSEEDLNKYRNSELFARVWSATKPLFDSKAEAWTVKQVMV